MTGWTRLPIRRRLSIAAAASMALVICAFGVFVYSRTGSDLLDAVDAGLRSRAELLANDLQHRESALANVEPTLIESDEVFAQIADSSGQIVQSSPIISGHRLLSAADARGAGKATYFDRAVPGIDNVARILAVPVETSRGRFAVLVGASLQDRQDALDGLASTLVIAGCIAVGLLSLGAWAAVSGALRPVERMRRQAAVISAAGRWRRLSPAGGNDELARLGATLNQMLDRIEESVDRERRLVDKASHELRTPLAIQRIDLDLALSGPQTAAELSAALRSVSQENEHLTRLTEDLLVLARAREGSLPVRLTETSLADLLQDACRRSSSLAQAGTAVNFTAADARVRVDPGWFRQAIGNLLDNALRHAPPGGQVDVRADCISGTLVLVVEDTGPGFDDAFLDIAFEPFARSASSPGARAGSTGLGLAVVRAVAEAHGGRAWAENRAGGGARVTMTASASGPLPSEIPDDVG